MENTRKVAGLLDKLGLWLEDMLMWLVYPLIAVMVAEIAARYFFLRPLPWVKDVSIWLFAIPFMLTVALYYRRKAHISAEDLVYAFRLSDSTRATIDLVHHFILLSVAGVLLWPSIQAVMRSFALRELSGMTTWRPILWPFRAVIPIALLFLGVQAVVGLLEAAGKLRREDKQ